MNRMSAEYLEAQAEAALAYLENGAEEHAKARADMEHMEDFIKVELARIKGKMIYADSDAAKTSLALQSEDYQKALENLRTAREAWHTINFKREAKKAIFEAWRTACSNMRANV